MKTALLCIIFFATCLTAGAQTLVKDILPGSSGGTPTNFMTLNGITYFVASDSIHGFELWRTDGTGDGTYMVKDVCPGPNDGLYFNYDDPFWSALNPLGNNFYFFADADSANYRLWKSDGTEAGTVPVSNVVVQEEAISDYMIPMGNYLYFTADDSSQYQRSQLWRTDGTTNGTVQITDTSMNIEVYNIDFVDGNTMYLNADSGYDGTCLFKTDGTKQGFTFLARPQVYYQYDLEYYNFIKYNGAVYYESFDTAHGSELWISDGTPQGTHIAFDAIPGWGSGGPASGMVILNNKLIYSAFADSVGTELFYSNGTGQGTGVLKDIWPGNGVNQSSNPNLFTVYNNKVIFEATDSLHGEELWVTDGTHDGTQLLYDINTATESDYGKDGDPQGLTVVNGLLYLTAYDSINGEEPWVTDGTPQGTHLLVDICPGTCYGRPYGFTGNGQMMLFDATSDELGAELYRVGEPTGILPITNAVNFRLQPNPANGHVTIITDAVTGGTIQLVDITGREVLSTALESSAYQLNTSHLPGGLYIVKVSDKTGATGVQKLVIE